MRLSFDFKREAAEPALPAGNALRAGPAVVWPPSLASGVAVLGLAPAVADMASAVVGMRVADEAASVCLAVALLARNA